MTDITTTCAANSRSRFDGRRDVELSTLLKVWWDHKWLIAVMAVLGGAVLAGSVMLTKRVYRAEALVALADQDAEGSDGSALGQVSALASIAGINLNNSGRRRAEYVALLTSRKIAAEIIRDQALAPVLVPKEVAAGRRSGKMLIGPAVLNDAVDKFLRNVISVSENPQTGLVSLSVDWHDPAEAAALATEIISGVNQKVRSTAIEEAKKTIEFLNRELGHTNVLSVREGIYRLVETNLSRIALANARPEYAFRVIDPPVAPNENRYVWPRPILEISAGILLGGILGVGVATFVGRRRLFPQAA